MRSLPKRSQFPLIGMQESQNSSFRLEKLAQLPGTWLLREKRHAPILTRIETPDCLVATKTI
jgi:hypothetical protein